MKLILALLLSSQSALGANQVDTFGIKDAAVTNVKMASMANATFKCRTSAGVGAPEDCNASQVNAILNGGTQAVNTVYAGPSSGSAAAPTFRSLVGEDLPLPISGHLGGVLSNACLTHNVFNSLDTSGNLSCTQLGFLDLSGNATTGQMPTHVVYDNVASAFTAKIVQSTSPVASTPALKLTGGVYVAGTGTTNTPSFLIEDASSSAWSTSGTYFGIDATSAFTGNLLDLQLNGTSKFSVDYTGRLTGIGSGLTTLNASNLSSGTVPAARMPAHTGDVTTSAGAVATTVAAIQGTTVSGTTGTGNVVFSTSPTLVTPTLGVATGTTWNGATLNCGAGSCSFLGTPGKSVAFNNSLAFSGTDGSTLNIGTGGTLGSLAFLSALPNPSSSTLGGTQSKAVVASNFLTGISTSGVPSAAQPAFTDITGAVTAAQLPTLATSTISALAIDWSTLAKTGGIYSKTLAANSTFTFSNLPASGCIEVWLTNTASNWTVTWPAVVNWPAASAPTQTIGAKTDRYSFCTRDGTNVAGAAIQNYSGI